MEEKNYLGRQYMKPFPKIVKNGAISAHSHEPTPMVYKGRFIRLENHGKMRNREIHIVDYFTNELLSVIEPNGTWFYSGYCEGDKLYAFSTWENKMYRFETTDLKNWEKKLVLEFPENFELFNTSICKGDGKYVAAIEGAWAGQSKLVQNDGINPYVGVHYTCFFAESPDLENWTLLPFEDAYTPTRYNACPAIRYCDGYYYMICLEELPLVRYAPYMYRTADFKTWEAGMCNPLFIASEEDRHTKPGVTLDPETEFENARGIIVNNSDVDLCEYEGKTYINYLGGDQGNSWCGLLCEAVYDGPLDEYLKANF